MSLQAKRMVSKIESEREADRDAPSMTKTRSRTAHEPVDDFEQPMNQWTTSMFQQTPYCTSNYQSLPATCPPSYEVRQILQENPQEQLLGPVFLLYHARYSATSHPYFARPVHIQKRYGWRRGAILVRHLAGDCLANAMAFEGYCCFFALAIFANKFTTSLPK